jgi:hypothetical protein
LEARKDEEEDIYALFYFFLTRLRVKTAISQGKKDFAGVKRAKWLLMKNGLFILLTKNLASA